MPNKQNYSRPPRYIAGYKDGELIGLRTTKEWAAATGIPMGTIADAAREGRQTRAGYTFKWATEEQMQDRQYLRQGMNLKQMAKAAKANNMSYGQLQAERLKKKVRVETRTGLTSMREREEIARNASDLPDTATEPEKTDESPPGSQNGREIENTKKEGQERMKVKDIIEKIPHGNRRPCGLSIAGSMATGG